MIHTRQYAFGNGDAACMLNVGQDSTGEWFFLPKDLNRALGITGHAKAVYSVTFLSGEKRNEDVALTVFPYMANLIVLTLNGAKRYLRSLRISEKDNARRDDLIRWMLRTFKRGAVIPTEVLPAPVEEKGNSMLTQMYNDMQVRVIVDGDGGVLFMAMDVCKVLGTNTRDVRKILKKDEVVSVNVDSIHIKGSSFRGKDPIFIAESGLYSLILKSRKKEAEPFQQWVSREVLPSIRKTGKYEVQAVSERRLPATYLEALKELVATEEERLRLETELADEKLRVTEAENKFSKLDTAVRTYGDGYVPFSKIRWIERMFVNRGSVVTGLTALLKDKSVELNIPLKVLQIGSDKKMYLYGASVVEAVKEMLDADQTLMEKFRR